MKIQTLELRAFKPQTLWSSTVIPQQETNPSDRFQAEVISLCFAKTPLRALAALSCKA